MKKAKKKRLVKKKKEGLYYFDKKAGQAAVDFFAKALVHIKGTFAGKPFKLPQWEDDLTRKIFGWKCRIDNSRRYKTVYIEVPRKNGKSTWLAGIGAYLLFCDKELGAEIYSLAAEKEQAAIIFEIASGMVEANQTLDNLSESFRRVITVPSTRGSWKVLSSESKSKHGYNPHGVLFDELHAQPNRELYDVMATGEGARSQPLTVYLTTAGIDRNSVCWQEHRYAESVIDGTIEDNEYLAVIYKADENDDWTKEKIWKKANPNYPTSPTKNYMERKCRRAINTPGFENTFKRLHLNIWTEQDMRWLSMSTWRAIKTEFTEKSLEGKEAFAGLDMASISDVAAFVLYFPEEGHKVIPYFFVPKDNAIKRSKHDKVPYELWIKQGYINATPGNVIDYDYVREFINKKSEQFNIREIAVDRWNTQQLQTQLDGDGFKVVPFGQGYASMTAPTKELEKLVVSKKLVHGHNPVLTWMASNVAVKQDPAGNLKPDKDKSYERIDGIVSLIMAIGRAISDEGEDQSPYEKRGIRVL